MASARSAVGAVFISVLALSLGVRADIRFELANEAAGIDHVGENWAAAWGDYNGDGRLDVWINKHGIGAASLYRNEGDGTFRDVASEVGLVLPLSTDAHGATWVDFDNDGDQDLLQLDDGGSDVRNRNLLYRNLGDGTFEEVAQALDVDLPLGHGRMPLWFDADSDGTLDLFHPSSVRDGDPENYTRLFIGTEVGFFDLTGSAGIDVTGANFATLADVDDDGVVDFLVDAQDKFPTLALAIGRLPFTDLRETVDLPLESVIDAVVQDLDGDLRADAFLVRGPRSDEIRQTADDSVLAGLNTCGADQGFRATTEGDLTLTVLPFFQFLGNPFVAVRVGSEDQRYDQADALLLTPEEAAGFPDYVSAQEEGVFIGYEDGAWTVRLSALCFNARLQADFSVPMQNFETINYAPPEESPDLLYLARAGGWVDATADANLPAPSKGVSVVAADFDNDMDLDIYIAARGAIENEPNRLYENDGSARFTLVPGAGGAESDVGGRANGVTVVDYDLDGFVDILVSNGYVSLPNNADGPMELYRNQGNGNHWLQLDLVGIDSNRDAVGAQAYVTAGGVTQLRIQSSGSHFRGQNAQRLHFGLASAERTETTVIEWPSGVRQVFADEGADQLLVLYETPGSPVVCPWSDDLDSDDDGLLDSHEDANGNGLVDPNETDPCRADSDGDGLLDGTEVGVTHAIADPDDSGRFKGTDLAIFVPDLDPDSRTDPLDADSDDDGIDDGEEDANGNGRVDEGETDPTPVRVPAAPWWMLVLLAVLLGTTVRRDGRRRQRFD
ncbi:MAG: FG-GAP-like repeat-containing protein [Pseudomonadota bacterium]